SGGGALGGDLSMLSNAKSCSRRQHGWLAAAAWLGVLLLPAPPALAQAGLASRAAVVEVRTLDTGLHAGLGTTATARSRSRPRPPLPPGSLLAEPETAGTDGPGATPSGPAVQVTLPLTAFDGLHRSESGSFTPPDTQAAAGPAHVFEVVN